MRKTRWLAAAVVPLLLVGCAAKPQDLIVGKWETADALGKVQMAEFNKDGTASMPIPIIGLRADGKYKFVDDQNIVMEFGAHNVKAKVAVTKETLTLTEEKGATRIYKRVSQ